MHQHKTLCCLSCPSVSSLTAILVCYRFATNKAVLLASQDSLEWAAGFAYSGPQSATGSQDVWQLLITARASPRYSMMMMTQSGCILLWSPTCYLQPVGSCMPAKLTMLVSVVLSVLLGWMTNLWSQFNISYAFDSGRTRNTTKNGRTLMATCGDYTWLSVMGVSVARYRTMQSSALPCR